MTALERLRALRISEKPPSEALTELTKAPCVSFVSGRVGAISKNTRPDPAPSVASNAPPATLPHAAARWLADVARHLDTTPDELLAAGVILRDEVPAYAGRDPGAFAAAISRSLRAHARTRAMRAETAAEDDRRHCATCQQLAGTRCRARRLLVMDNLPRRCADYLPMPGDADQRPGRDRWPSLMTPLETCA